MHFDPYLNYSSALLFRARYITIGWPGYLLFKTVAGKIMARNRTALFEIPVERLTESDARSELKELAELIAHHDRLYHEKDAPEISDAEYDALRQRNAAIEARFSELILPESPSRKVGAAPAAGFKKVPHRVPMLSLDNAFTAEDVFDWLDSIRNFLRELKDPEVAIEILCEPKIDGLSCSLRYEQGKLVGAATRGNGVEGEDVTANVMTITDVPRTLKGRGWPEVLEVRGEVYMTDADFLNLNAQQEASRGKAVCQSAECRGRQPAAAGLCHHRRTTAAVYRTRLGRDFGDVCEDAIRSARQDQTLGVSAERTVPGGNDR